MIYPRICIVCYERAVLSLALTILWRHLEFLVTCGLLCFYNGYRNRPLHIGCFICAPFLTFSEQFCPKKERKKETSALKVGKKRHVLCFELRLKSPARKLEAVLLRIIKGKKKTIPFLQLMSQMMGVHKILISTHEVISCWLWESSGIINGKRLKWYRRTLAVILKVKKVVLL